jgi:hypothetical protein
MSGYCRKKLAIDAQRQMVFGSVPNRAILPQIAGYRHIGLGKPGYSQELDFPSALEMSRLRD